MVYVGQVCEISKIIGSFCGFSGNGLQPVGDPAYSGNDDNYGLAYGGHNGFDLVDVFYGTYGCSAEFQYFHCSFIG